MKNRSLQFDLKPNCPSSNARCVEGRRDFAGSANERHSHRAFGAVKGWPAAWLVVTGQVADVVGAAVVVLNGLSPWT